MEAPARSRRVAHDVWLVEENPLAARYLLKASPRVRFKWAGGYREALRRGAARARSPRVLVVDCGQIPALGAEFLQPIQAVFHNSKILLVGMPIPEEELCRLVLLGARGFVTYRDVAKHLASAVEHIREGHLWIERGILDKLPAYAARAHLRPHNILWYLTPREKNVVSLLRKRLADKELASAIGISERTVRFHLQNIFKKLGLHDRHSVTDLARAVFPSEAANSPPAEAEPVTQRGVRNS